MPNPTPKYRVKYDGNYLPGYVQREEIPLTMRNVMVDIINRDGGTTYQNGAAFRQLDLEFRILSRLESGTGPQHLSDCLEQYRDALRYTSRVTSASTLYLGDMDAYLLARFNSATAPLAAPDHKAINYQISFDCTPYFLGPAVSGSKAISGNDNIVLNMPDTRKTYPVVDIPTGITNVTVSHAASGKSFNFGGTHANTVEVNCASLTVTDTAGANYVSYITTGPDFGIYHVGSGSFQLNFTNVSGSGTISVLMNPRIER